MEDLVGQKIKGYELRERIGAGGFGAVYRGYQSTVGREIGRASCRERVYVLV